MNDALTGLIRYCVTSEDSFQNVSTNWNTKNNYGAVLTITLAKLELCLHHSIKYFDLDFMNKYYSKTIQLYPPLDKKDNRLFIRIGSSSF